MRIAMLGPVELFRWDGLQVPAYQCTYRWQQERWMELWELLREQAAARMSGTPRRLFMGGVILDTHPPGTHGAAAQAETRRDIVDGQHRLTTLQLALAAAQDVAGEFGCCFPHLFPQPIHHRASQLIASGYLYFCEELRRWLHGFAPKQREMALRSLQATLHQDLWFLVFDLERTPAWRVFHRLFADRVWPARRRMPVSIEPAAAPPAVLVFWR